MPRLPQFVMISYIFYQLDIIMTGKYQQYKYRTVIVYALFKLNPIGGKCRNESISSEVKSRKLWTAHNITKMFRYRSILLPYMKFTTEIDIPVVNQGRIKEYAKAISLQHFTRTAKWLLHGL